MSVYSKFLTQPISSESSDISSVLNPSQVKQQELYIFIIYVVK